MTIMLLLPYQLRSRCGRSVSGSLWVSSSRGYNFTKIIKRDSGINNHRKFSLSDRVQK